MFASPVMVQRFLTSGSGISKSLEMRERAHSTAAFKSLPVPTICMGKLSSKS